MKTGILEDNGKDTCTCTCTWWAQQLEFSRANIWRELVTTYNIYTGQWFWTTYRLNFMGNLYADRLIHGYVYGNDLLVYIL